VLLTGLLVPAHVELDHVTFGLKSRPKLAWADALHAVPSFPS